MSKFVGILDSGIGGLSILKACADRMLNVNFVYLADTKYAPYGNKSKKEILQTVNNATNYLIDNYNIKVLILACNTATVTCIDELRKRHDIQIIGVEPAVKKAILHKKILILSTRATKKNSKLLKYYKKYKNIKLVAKRDWAHLIDCNIDNLENIQNKFSINYKNNKCNDLAVVLGCTHYSFLKSILKIKYPQYTFYDSAEDIAKKLEEIPNIDEYCGKRLIKCISSQNNYKISQNITKIYKTIY